MGITMYEVMTLHSPYEGMNLKEIKTELKSNKYPEIRLEEVKGCYDEGLVRVVNKMLSVYNFCYFILYFLYFCNSH
jgi:hypothetical protein